jgi:hypothetical protein
MFHMTGHIYALHLDGSPFRYVGMTNQKPETRLRQHRKHPARTSHLPLNVWIDEVGPTNVRMTILETVTEGTDVSDRERHWIAEFQRQGIELLNRTLGGQRGPLGYRHTPEECARRAIQSRNIKNATGAYRSPEYRENMSAALVGKRCPEGCTCGRHFPSPERGARISAAKRARKAERGS